MKVDLPPMFGPVISSRRRSGDSAQSLAMKRSICFSTTGWRPCSIADARRSFTSSGARQSLRTACSASAVSASSWASAWAMPLQRADDAAPAPASSCVVQQLSRASARSCADSALSSKAFSSGVM
jgi:hypothetical protein